MMETAHLLVHTREMTPEESALFDEILKKAYRDISKLRSMGITDYAIVTFVARVRGGQPYERALRGLLQGRRLLAADEKQLIREIVCNLPIKAAGNNR